MTLSVTSSPRRHPMPPGILATLFRQAGARKFRLPWLGKVSRAGKVDKPGTVDKGERGKP